MAIADREFRCAWLLSAALAVTVGSMVQAAPPLAELMASAPNRGNPWAAEANPLPPLETLAGVDQHFWVKVGPPDASLSVSLVEPASLAQTRHGPMGQTDGSTASGADPSAQRAPRATILVLHGVLARSLFMLPVARRLAQAGYRAVLVDLRGAGRSTGQYMTYGVQEAKDLSQVIDELQRRHLVAGPLGVYGISYGAATSIHLAGIDRRIQAVVAVEPFSTAREEIPHFGRVMVPGIGLMVSEKTYQESIDEAGRLAEFDPDAADASKAIQKTSAPVLLIHGTNDWVVPHQQSEQLHAAAPGHSQLVSIPCLGHTALWIDADGRVARLGREWFDRWLIGETPAAVAR